MCSYESHTHTVVVVAVCACVGGLAVGGMCQLGKRVSFLINLKQCEDRLALTEYAKGPLLKSFN